MELIHPRCNVLHGGVRAVIVVCHDRIGCGGPQGRAGRVGENEGEGH